MTRTACIADRATVPPSHPSFAHCTPQYLTHAIMLADIDGGMVDDATDEDILAYLRDGVVSVDPSRAWYALRLDCHLVWYEDHCDCDPDACPLGACGLVTRSCDYRDDEIMVARDAVLADRPRDAIALVLASVERW